MTIRLNWPSQAAKGLTSIEIYRKVGWDATLDVNNPGTPYATLAADATEFIENIDNLTSKTIYKYWIGAVKGTERLIGAPVLQGFFLDTGPGPQTLLRGDWAAGYFGSIPREQFFNSAEIKLQLTSGQASLFQYDPPVWHKFVFRGRIIFIPSTRHALSYSALSIYNQGMALGIDGVGSVLPNGSAGIAQNCKVTKDGRTYRIRLPYATDYNATAGDRIFTAGEWANTMGRMFLNGNNNYGLQGLGALGSLPLFSGNSSISDEGAAILAPFYTVTNIFYSYASDPVGISWANYNSIGSAWFVFELVLP